MLESSFPQASLLPRRIILPFPIQCPPRQDTERHSQACWRDTLAETALSKSAGRGVCVVEAIQGDLVKRARQGEAELSRVGQVKNYDRRKGFFHAFNGLYVLLCGRHILVYDRLFLLEQAYRLQVWKVNKAVISEREERTLFPLFLCLMDIS